MTGRRTISRTLLTAWTACVAERGDDSHHRRLERAQRELRVELARFTDPPAMSADDRSGTAMRPEDLGDLVPAGSEMARLVAALIGTDFANELDALGT